MAERVGVLVIGGGAVGCSCLYHLARSGCTDCLLLERDELTAGSTWHAAGNCPTFATSPALLRLQHYSALLYRRLAADADYPINFHPTGSVRLAHTEDRLDEYRHVIALAQAIGLDYRLLSPEELRERYPLLTLEDLRGALWDPLDGDIDPAQLTQALAAGARRLGARIRRGTRVTALARTRTGEWRIGTPQGEILAQVVVNAAGYRAGEIMALLGRYLPGVTLCHQYLVTDEVPELLERRERLPLLRDPDLSYYLRQERGGFLLGPYEARPQAAWLDGIPGEFAFGLFADDLERLEPQIEAAYRRVPALAAAGIRRIVNGPIPYSPDGLPYLGPAPGLENLFHCNTFSFGIAQAGGAGKALADYVVHGAPEWDLWAIDPRRFTGYATPPYTLAKALETYRLEYAPAFPGEERPAGRPLRTSPLHERLAARGACFGVRGGWERALWYDSRGMDPPGASLPHAGFRRDRALAARVGTEVRAVRTSAGMADLPGFTKFLIEGAGAEACLDRLLCSRLPRPGRVGLAYALDARGRVQSEFTLTRLGPESFYAVSAAAAEWHDEDLLRRALPSGAAIRIAPLTESWGTLVLAGPGSRALLARTGTDDWSNDAFPWLSARWIRIGGVRALALRLSYVGELGWELHAKAGDLPPIYDALLHAAGGSELVPFGLHAIDSLRMDKCYRGWKSDLSADISAWEASLDRFVDLSKAEFIGREALLAEQRAGIARRLVPLQLDDAGSAEVPAGSPVYAAGERVGFATSGAFSYTLDCSLALACVRADCARPGTLVTIQVLGERCSARVGREPLYDPDNRRLRS